MHCPQRSAKSGETRRHARVTGQPKLTSEAQRLDTDPRPPMELFAGAVQVTVMGATEWHREFVTGPLCLARAPEPGAAPVGLPRPLATAGLAPWPVLESPLDRAVAEPGQGPPPGLRAASARHSGQWEGWCRRQDWRIQIVLAGDANQRE